ncbi:NAD kinase 2, chloroplastic isoform X2 [Aristolochia californica]|uniref:NAD kinase 2, chloroplastic isoform X2 n=1 Tax=Aristolochia californica TaxID=171875 RepID=UPI0035DC41E7
MEPCAFCSPSAQCHPHLPFLSPVKVGPHSRRSSLHVRGDSRRRMNLAVAAAARLSSFFASKIGLDTQAFQAQDLSQASWIGPVPGDIAEIEAYCRIFRAAEQLHIAIMETLCNPITGECTVSYSIPSEEMPSLEEKVVAVLGCIVALLNRGREDVLSGRSSVTNMFKISDINIVEDKLPPLALFRREMRRCCESLHVALENYLTPADDRIAIIWRRLQRLKNVCYDAGFPREPDYPCQSVFANWAPVYLSVPTDGIGSNESEVAFWKGGQVTDEGLFWLIEKGFKTIVDLRAEVVKDESYKAAMDEAISCGKIEVVRLTVEVGTAPTMDQVQEFAALVYDSKKKPIYLHSQEGVWRTSAMVSRWRQYIVRSGSLNNIVNLKENESSSLYKEDAMPRKDEIGSNSENASGGPHGHFSRKFRKFGGESEGESEKRSKEHNIDSSEKNGSIHRAEAFVEPLSNFPSDYDPFKAQFLTCNVFSRREMRVFFKNRKISPSTFFRKRFEIPQISANVSQARETHKVTDEPGSSNGTLTESDLFRPHHSSMNNTPISSDLSVNRFGGRDSSLTPSNMLEKKCTAMEELTKKSCEVHPVSVDEGLEQVDGNMCASATGVVRVQSRKKAEMFLVRTDGFSCTREKVTEASLAFTHPSTQQQMLMWKSLPKTVLLLKKLGPELMEEAKEAALFLHYQENMNVLVEPDVHDMFARIPGFGFVQTFYSQDTSYLHERVDFVACLGGDGVILHASNLFRGAVPPVVSFNLGSLGFLTSHTFDDFRQDLKAVIHGNNTADGVYITLRMRLRCEIFRNGKAIPGKVFDVLNEVVVDRGSNPYLSKIECYEHDRLITKVQGDGVIVATPTGSTAYSTAAGGSMVHPNVPCILFTPICPHSLSFRPVILPDSAQFELKIPEETRSNAWVSFDGKRRQQLSRGDSVKVCMSQHPLPTVNKSDQTGDWFRSLIRCLNWNERLDQKAL